MNVSYPLNSLEGDDPMSTKRSVLFAAIGLLVLAGCVPIANPSAPEAASYTVTLSAADFVAVVDNLYYPLIPGTRYAYEARLEDGTRERNEIEILQETREVNGVTATVVHDTVYVEAQLVEETFDWYAQDKDGNVWYLGEAV